MEKDKREERMLQKIQDQASALCQDMGANAAIIGGAAFMLRNDKELSVQQYDALAQRLGQQSITVARMSALIRKSMGPKIAIVQSIPAGTKIGNTVSENADVLRKLTR